MPTSISGTANTFGFGATNTSGAPWPVGMTSITIGGVTYSATFVDSTHITISPAAPIAEGVGWSASIGDDPDPEPDGGPGGHTGFVPLSMECQCDPHGRGTCAIRALEFIISGDTGGITFVDLKIGYLDIIDLSGGTTLSVDPADFIEVDVPLIFHFAQSLRYTGLERTSFGITAHATYECLLPDGNVVFQHKYGTFDADTANSDCFSDDGTRYFHCTVDGDGGRGYIVHSSPLGCSDCTAGPVMGRLPFKSEMIDDNTDEDPWCLCPLGGTSIYNGDGSLASPPVYAFALVDGELPAGQILNTRTGCIEGPANSEHPGTPTVTFRVIDVRSGEHADVVCGLASPPCSGTPAANAFL